MKNDISCEQARNIIFLNGSGESSVEQIESLKKHLSYCASCNNFLKQSNIIISEYKAIHSNITVSKDIIDNIVKEYDRKSGAILFSVFLKTYKRVTAIAAILLVFLFLWISNYSSLEQNPLISNDDIYTLIQLNSPIDDSSNVYDSQSQANNTDSLESTLLVFEGFDTFSIEEFDI